MKHYPEYIQILKEELKPAMGCTEPIAIAYATCICRDALGVLPEKVEIRVSGNILKNVKSVVVPNTNGLRGIRSAVAIGVTSGCSDMKLECISKVSKEQRAACEDFLKKTPIEVSQSESDFVFDIQIKLFSAQNEAESRIVDTHTNLVYLRHNEHILFEKEIKNAKTVSSLIDRSILSVEGIFDFATNADLEPVREILELQIKYNTAIAEEGLKHSYGASIGRTLLKAYPNDVAVRAKAYAAAGSDARMNGCELPVIINSGSGNQGMTCSLPVIVYAKELRTSHDKLLRALALSNLLTIHIKTGIGRLSAYCGAVAAGSAVGGAIAYLHQADLRIVSHTIVNALAIVSGIICDGAKASCAAKIASSVDAGILGFKLIQEGNQFYSGEGIITKGIENTIRNIGLLASEGMVETDKEIIHLMLEN